MLHKVFNASPDPNPMTKEMGQACFDYLSLRGIFSNGFMSVLSAPNPNPLFLFLQLFALVAYGVGRLLLMFPSPQRVWFCARLLAVSLFILCFASCCIIHNSNNVDFSATGLLWNYFSNHKSRGS